MTRVLDFTGPHGPQRFALCRLAVLSAGDGKGDRTRETIRKEARLLDALDFVSLDDPTEKDGRALHPGGGTVTLPQDDFALLLQYVDSCPWVPRVSRDAVDAQDWLSAAAKVDA